MAIFKAKVRTSFSAIPNKTLQDKRLTFEATGLLAMLLSLPEDWEIHKDWLQKQKQKCGRDKLTRMMKELQDAGYVTKIYKQEDGGRMNGVDWFVYPVEQLQSRTTENADSGKPATTKETSLQSKQETNNTSCLSGDKPLNVPYQNIIDVYNKTADDTFPRVKLLTTTRKPKMKKFWGLMGKNIDKVQEYFAYFNYAATPHQRGNNDRGWVANFDFIIKEDTIAKIIEGGH